MVVPAPQLDNGLHENTPANEGNEAAMEVGEVDSVTQLCNEQANRVYWQEDL